MTTISITSTGTIKIGRWEYPARTEQDGSGSTRVLRNTKRDGSGEWTVVPVPAAANYTPRAWPESAPAIPGFVDEVPTNYDYDDLRVAYLAIWDGFAVLGYTELADAVGCDVPRAKALARHLDQAGLVVIDPKYKPDGGNKTETLIQAFESYDNITRVEAIAKFVEAVPTDVTVRATSTHGGKVGAQTKRPGRSTWAVGDLCPQGHTITDEDGDNPVYVMRSGRKQCRKCRAGYASNGGSAA